MVLAHHCEFAIQDFFATVDSAAAASATVVGTTNDGQAIATETATLIRFSTLRRRG